jgi:plastocyanin
MRRLPLILTVLVLFPVVLGAGGATAAPSGGSQVLVTGEITMERNRFFGFSYRFAPTTIEVPSGDTLTFDGSTFPLEPHTASIVRRQDLPATALESIRCGMGGICAAIIARHEAQGPIVEDDPDEEEGLDGPGDSLALPPDVAVSRTVTAPPGTTLYYLCAIHPWMQGMIRVTN